MTSKIQINFRFRGYWWLCLIKFWNFFSIYVFEVSESIFDIPTELPCLGDPENPVNFRFRRYWWFCLTQFWKIFSIYVFEVNFRYKRHSEVLMIVSYEYLKFLQYSCFRGWGINFWFFWATVFGWSRKSRSTSGTRKFWWLYLMNFQNLFSIYVFEVKESIYDIPTELPCSNDLKNLGQLPVQEVLMILLSNVWNFSTIYVFEVRESIANIFLLRYLVWATSKSGSMSGSRGFRDHPNKVAQLECQ